MQSKRYFFSICIFFALAVTAVIVLPASAHAATCTVVAGGGNWSSTGTWSCGAVPTSADAVVAGASSGNLTVNTAGSAASLDFTGYTGTLTMTSSLTASGNVTLSNAMAISGTGGLTVNNTATLTSNGKTWPGDLTVGANGSNVVLTLADNATINGSFSTVSSGSNSTTLNGNALMVGGSLLLPAPVLQGTTTIVLNGTGTWSGLGSVSNNITISTSGTITLSGTVTYGAGTFTYIAGAVVTTGSTFVINASITLPSGIIWNNVTVGKNGSNVTVTLAGDTTITGTFSNISSGSNVDTINGNVLYVGGSLSVPGPFLTGTTMIVLNGTGTWSQSFANNVLQNPLTINTSGTITLGSNVSYNTGTLTVAAGTLDLAGNSISASSGTFVVDSGATLKLKGNETVPTFTFNSGGNATYYGTSSYSSLPLNTYSNLTFNGTGGTWTLNHALTVSNTLTLTAGTLDTSATGCSSASCSITVAGTFNHAGGTFTPHTGTVTLNGTNQEIEGNTTFYNLSKIATGADSLTFVSSSTTTIAPGGTLTLKGANANSLLTLQSSTNGTQWNLNVPNTATANGTTLQYLAIQDSDASSGSPIDVTGGHDQDQGNNKYWVTEELPTNLTATSSPTNNDQVDLSWSPNGNFTNTQWYAETTDTSRTTGYLTYPVQSYSFTGLACHTAYTFHIKSRNGTATTESAYTTSVTATTGACSSGFAGSTAPAASSSSQNIQSTNPNIQTNPNDQNTNPQPPTTPTTPPPSDTGSGNGELTQSQIDYFEQLILQIAQQIQALLKARGLL